MPNYTLPFINRVINIQYLFDQIELINQSGRVKWVKVLKQCNVFGATLLWLKKSLANEFMRN